VIPFNFPQVAFGRKEHDPAWLASVRPHTYSATRPPPSTLPRPTLVWKPSLVSNDTLPTCTIAGLINSARIWTMIRNDFDLTEADASLLAFYAALAGCADTTEAIAASSGLRLQDVLEAAGRGKFTAGQQAPLIPEPRSIDPTDPIAIRDAIFRFESAYIGLTLYEADMQPGAEWVGGIENAGQPVGGHCVLGMRYSPTGISVATWGAEMEMDNEFFASRCNETFALPWTLTTAPGATS
jgi:hypothetical protein